MTKHLRLIMLSLLAMICMGGYSQEKSVTCTLTDKGETIEPKGELVLSYSRKIDGNNESGYFWNCANGEVTVTAKLKDSNAKISKIVANAKCKKETPQLEVKVGEQSLGQQKLTTDYTDYEFPCEQGLSGDIKLWFTGKADSKPGSYFLKTITVYYTPSNQTLTNTTFGTDYDGNTFNFVGGVLEGWNAPTAKYTPAEADGKISYESDNQDVATVDENGQLTFNGYGTAKITATFTPKETEKYAKSSASYTVINKEPYVVEFVAGIQTSKDNTLKNNGVNIYNSNGRFYENDGYRFYKGTTLRFSVQQGIITKIEMEGKGDYPLTGINLTKGGGEVSKTSKTMIWTGLANVVQFSTSAQARAATIRVTVKPHYTLDETVDNVIEAKENVYVTLKRTFFHDNAWNTLCLPFDVADASAAFGGAEIREIDLSQCTDNTIQFVPATEIKAGVPYIIKWNENVADAQTFEKTFERVTLVAEPKPVKVNNDITFTGFYKMTAANDLGGTSVAAIGAGSKLFTVGEGKMKGFRAAFVLSSNAQASKYKVVIDGTATGIEDLVIDSAKANGRVYNLNGQYVGNNLNGLQPGLYIQNGKKIVVK